MGTERRPERTGIIPGMLGSSSHRPRAAGLQKSRTTADDVLVGLARENHPTVVWWWGVRKREGIMCAWCYLCDAVITGGALNVGITEAQAGDIEEHKAGHWQDAMTALTDRKGL